LKIIETKRHFLTTRRTPGGGKRLGKPETFNFLGFAFICGKSRAEVNSKSNGNSGVTACGRSCKHQTGTATTHSSADRRTGKMVETGRHRIL
jgi:hypothetical protein